jgi:hypothetical protein
MMAKEGAVRDNREVVSPVELGVDLSPESEDRIGASVISELREEIGAAKASADAAKAVADDAKKTAEDAKLRIPDGVTGVLDSDSIRRVLGCIKYELKKLKSREVSEVPRVFIYLFCKNFGTGLQNR